MNGADHRVGTVTVGGALRVLVASTSPEKGPERSLLGFAPLLGTARLASGGVLRRAGRPWGLPHVEFAVPSRSGLRATGGGRPGVRELAGEVAEYRAGERTATGAVGPGGDRRPLQQPVGHLDCAVAGRISGRPVVLELHDLVRPGLGRIARASGWC